MALGGLRPGGGFRRDDRPRGGPTKAAAKERPCPVCGATAGCSSKADGLLFCRKSSGPVPGFVHLGQSKGDDQYGQYRRADDPELSENQPGDGRPPPAANGRATNGAPPIDWRARARGLASRLTREGREALAEDLGVPSSLWPDGLEVGFGEDDGGPFWSFSGVDADGNVVAILRRYVDPNKKPRKKAMKGGKHGDGLIVPAGWDAEGADPLYVAEGPSDVIALGALGLAAVGRPNNTGGARQLARLLSRLPEGRRPRVVVLGEYDPKPDGKWPGRDGAVKVVGELRTALGDGWEVCWAMPPDGAKDARAWVTAQALDPTLADAWHVAGDAFAEAVGGQLQRPAAAAAAAEDKARGPAFQSSVACSQLQRVDPDKEWLWKGWMEREGVTLLSALWKAGKTTLLAHLLRAFGEGGVFLGGDVAPTQVLYISEESQGRWAKRRDALGLGDWIRFRCQPFTYKPNFAAWFAFLEDLKAEVVRDGVGLVVFDTLDKLWPVLKENDAGEVASALMPLRALPAASLLNHHLGKSDGKEGMASRGSGALTAFVDTIIEMRRYNPDDRSCRRRVLSGYGRSDDTPAELVIELAADGSEYTAYGDRGAAASSELDDVIRGVLLPDRGLTQIQIRQEWPEGARSPQRQALNNALNAGAEARQWRRTGAGKKGNPYLYFSVPDEADGEAPEPNLEQNPGPAAAAATASGISHLGPNGAAGDGFCSTPAPPGGENAEQKRRRGLSGLEDTHDLFPDGEQT